MVDVRTAVRLIFTVVGICVMAMSGRLSVKADPVRVGRLAKPNKPTAGAARSTRTTAANVGVRNVRVGFKVCYPIEVASENRRLAVSCDPSSKRGTSSVSRNAMARALAGAKLCSF